MIELTVKIKYDPKVLNATDAMFKKWWMIATVDGDFTEYYAWHVNKRTGLLFQKPAWGAHISVIRGEEPLNNKWMLHDGKEIVVQYDPDLRTNGEHWWANVKSEQLLDIREELGLTRIGEFGLHMTIGRPTHKCLETSHYYHRFFSKWKDTK